MKVFVKSYGCQMNAYDSARMTDLMGREGYAETGRPEDADLVILNTCHIREKAAEKVYSELGRLRELKEERALSGRGTRIVVAGCVAQAEGAEIVRRAPVVDVVVGPQSYHNLPRLLRETTGRSSAVETEFPADDKFGHLPPAARDGVRRRGVSAFLTVQEGCDKFCTFCVVPYTRGAEFSRPVAAVLDEARALIDGGVRELVLIGQNVNAYHGLDERGRETGLRALFERLAALPGLARIRYTTSHPDDMNEDLIGAHRDLPALMPYLHLPVQSGSDRVLAAMNRRYTADAFRRIVERLRAARPDIALSSDFIVGFPGETEAEFAETLALAAEIRFAASFSFNYSPRPGTPAAELAGQLPDTIQSERLARLQVQLDGDRRAFNAGFVGREVEVLIEKAGRHAGQMAGKSPYLQAVQIEAADARVGDIVAARVTGPGPNSLFAEPVVPATAVAA